MCFKFFLQVQCVKNLKEKLMSQALMYVFTQSDLSCVVILETQRYLDQRFYVKYSEIGCCFYFKCSNIERFSIVVCSSTQHIFSLRLKLFAVTYGL